MFEDTNYSHNEIEQLNKDFLEMQHYILLFIYVIVTILVCFMIFVCCMTYIHYIYFNKHRERLLKQEVRQNLLKYEEEKSDD
jgi:hypothetical protein